MPATMSNRQEKPVKEGQDGTPVTFRPPITLRNALEAEAANDFRSVAGMTIVLVREALEARRRAREQG